MKGQTKWMSFLESTSGTLFGFMLAVATNYYVLPRFGFEPSLGDALGITTIFGVISIARVYVWRRAFNWYQERKA